MIDWSRVQVLREELGDGDFGAVVELFLDEIECVAMRLNTGDPERIEGDLHFLKGSAVNLGFTSFASLCQMGEIEVRNGRAHALDLALLLECYSSTKKAFVARIVDSQRGVA